MRRSKIFVCLFAVGLASCGGGGGGSSAPADPTASFPPQTALTYSGASTQASVSATNAGVLASNVLGASASGTAGGIATGVSAQETSSGEAPTGVAGVGRRLAKAIRSGDLVRANSGAVTGAAIDQTTPCDSGSVRVFGNVSDTNGTGTVNVHYLNCRTGVDTVNGPATLNIVSNSGGVMTDGTLSFTRINFTGPGLNADMTGSIRSQVSTSSSSATETLTQNTVMLNNSTGRMTQAQNVRITNVYDDVDSPSFFTQNITGTVCESVNGCVAIATNTIPTTAPWGPFYYSTLGQSFPDWGQMTLTGATSRVIITSLGNAMAKLEVDSNNDGTIENTARLRWVDFNTAVGADLADSDGDGMHNSWETQKGLNPSSSADAAVDSDGDGWTNLQEYQRGSEPNTSGSIPGAVRSVWVTGVSDLAESGGNVQVFTGGGTSGQLLDPATAEIVGPFSGGTPSGNGTQVVDGSVTYTLTPTADPKVWTLSSSTGRAITITNIAGTSPSGLIRYGARGLAFRTTGASGPGYIYLVESMSLIP